MLLMDLEGSSVVAEINISGESSIGILVASSSLRGRVKFTIAIPSDGIFTVLSTDRNLEYKKSY